MKSPLYLIAVSALILICSFLSCSSSTPLVLGVRAQDPNPLPSNLKINPNTVTISGISAGAAMTVQVEFAFSKSVHAAGIIAGIPYGCSAGEVAGAFMCMDDPEFINLEMLMSEAKAASTLKQNDPWEHILNHTVTLFSGTQDTVVDHGTMLLVDQQYEVLGQPSANRLGIFNYSAEHAWITDFYGNECSHLGSPFLNNCGLDFAGIMLQRNFKALHLPWNPTRGKFNASNMFQFDQYKYGASSQYSLDSIGFVYVPTSCQSGEMECQLHINFHGCEQFRKMVGSIYVDHTGLNQWAETNNIVIVYPQTISSSILPYNPKGCFDWWGYAGGEWANKNGPQMKFVGKILKAMTGVNPF